VTEKSQEMSCTFILKLQKKESRAHSLSAQVWTCWKSLSISLLLLCFNYIFETTQKKKNKQKKEKTGPHNCFSHFAFFFGFLLSSFPFSFFKTPFKAKEQHTAPFNNVSY
jgi:hypothetical protein